MLYRILICNQKEKGERGALKYCKGIQCESFVNIFRGIKLCFSHVFLYDVCFYFVISFSYSASGANKTCEILR